MKYTVYHAVNPTFGFGVKPQLPGEYEKVAEVECSDLEDVFRVTNHIDEAWQENKEVLWSKRPARSTSVGDVIVDDTGDQYYCASVGWEKVENKS